MSVIGTRRGPVGRRTPSSTRGRCSGRDRYAPLRELAGKHQITPAQLALAWLVHQDVVPIPGTRTPQHVDEDLAAADLDLDDDTLAKIDEIARPGAAAGQRLL